MKRIVWLIAAATLIEYLVAQIVAPMLGYSAEIVVFPLVLIGNVGTALMAHFIYGGG